MSSAIQTNSAESPTPDSDQAPGLLSFYDRLRTRIVTAVERRGGRWGRATSSALLTVPDIFMLLVRLTLDSEVPKETRRLLGGALAYFLLPFDLLPEMLVGPGGYIDDLVLACIVLSEALGPDLEAFAARHWSGSGELRRLLTDISRSGEALLGEGLFLRVRKFLERRGLSAPR